MKSISRDAEDIKNRKEIILKVVMYSKKTLFICVFFTQLLFIDWVFSDENICPQSWKIQQCIDANKQWKNREIEEFVCINSRNTEQIAYQIVLDDKFKEIDQELELYLENLEADKSRFFWKNAKGNLEDAINEVNTYLWDRWYFWKQFAWICGQNKTYNWETAIEGTLSCLWKSSIPEGSKYLFWYDSECLALVRTKMHIAESVWYNILALNKAQIRRDESKLYMQAQRTQYNHLLDIMNINLWYLERMWMKLPKKLRNVI